MEQILENKWTEHTCENGVWKGSKIPLPEGFFKYGEKLLAIMKKNSALIGQVDAITGKEDTYGDMLDRSIRCALWLKKQNINPGDVISISSGSHLNAIIPVVSSFFIGSIINPWWDIVTEIELIQYFLDLTKPKVLFASEVNAELIQKIISGTEIQLKIVVFGKIEGLESFDDILAAQDPEEVKNFECTKIESPDHPAMILYTSGTTGKPKGVLKPYRSFVNRRVLCSEQLLYRSTGMIYSTFPWSLGITNILFAIEFGSKLIVSYGLSRNDSFKLIIKYQVEWIVAGTPVGFAMLIDPIFKQYDYSFVKFIVFGGSHMSQRVYRFLETTFPCAQIRIIYGLTETGSAMLCKKQKHPLNSCGTVTENNEIKIMSEDGNIVLEPNQEGEIWVKSVSPMLCYFKDPKSTAETLVADGWCRTGDLGYYTEDGVFFITDRIKELMKCKFKHVAPAPIENMILKHPGVSEVVVVGKKHDIDEEHPMAFVIKHEEIDVSEEEIIKLVGDNMPERYHLSGGVHFLDELPRTAYGKVAKRVLRHLALQISSK